MADRQEKKEIERGRQIKNEERGRVIQKKKEGEIGRGNQSDR